MCTQSPSFSHPNSHLLCNSVCINGHTGIVLLFCQINITVMLLTRLSNSQSLKWSLFNREVLRDWDVPRSGPKFKVKNGSLLPNLQLLCWELFNFILSDKQCLQMLGENNSVPLSIWWWSTSSTADFCRVPDNVEPGTRYPLIMYQGLRHFVLEPHD